MNFLNETLRVIKETGHSENDVLFVGSADGEYRISFDNFRKIANIDYDAGYGAQKIAEDLIVYFSNGDWLERIEYDGAESWKIIKIKRFNNNGNYKSFNKVCVDQNPNSSCGWETLKEINLN